MLYNSRASLISQTCDHSGPKTARPRLLHPGMGNDGGRRLAGGHGRLAARGGGLGALSRLRYWRCAFAAHRLGLREAHSSHARRCRRNCLHFGSLSSWHQFRNRLDDDARILHRLPLGSRRGGTRRSYHFPAHRLNRTLSRRRQAGIPPASPRRIRPDRISNGPQLSRSSPQRDLPELDQPLGLSHYSYSS